MGGNIARKTAAELKEIFKTLAKSSQQKSVRGKRVEASSVTQQFELQKQVADLVRQVEHLKMGKMDTPPVPVQNSAMQHAALPNVEPCGICGDFSHGANECHRMGEFTPEGQAEVYAAQGFQGYNQGPSRPGFVQNYNQGQSRPQNYNQGQNGNNGWRGQQPYAPQQNFSQQYPPRYQQQGNFQPAQQHAQPQKSSLEDTLQQQQQPGKFHGQPLQTHQALAITALEEQTWIPEQAWIPEKTRIPELTWMPEPTTVLEQKKVTALPSPALPSAALPSPALSNAALQSPMQPSSPLPESEQPRSPLPESEQPSSPLPESEQPSALQNLTLQNPAMQEPAIPSLALQHPAMRSSAMQNPAPQSAALPRAALQWSVMPNPVLQNYGMRKAPKLIRTPELSRAQELRRAPELIRRPELTLHKSTTPYRPPKISDHVEEVGNFSANSLLPALSSTPALTSPALTTPPTMTKDTSAAHLLPVLTSPALPIQPAVMSTGPDEEKETPILRSVALSQNKEGVLPKDVFDPGVASLRRISEERVIA
ncbi:uncharacterized protein LOC131008021 [Salvia miltiorrhiza]|uniref:uncharacterized protein LOC131008021 n=1 Tax=Salvia miltiorrhiza TaxID=226208 RepID=UPI0025AD4E71|nr:uncharacterized protein LOC131008021 [Salvia miltiorrhiza]